MVGRILGMLTALALSTTITGCSGSSSSGSSGSAPKAPTATRVSISVGECGRGWTRPVAGRQHFVLVNTDTRSGEVLLTDAGTAAVFAEVEPLAAGTSTDLDIDLGSGRYTFRCAMEDEGTVVGPSVVVPGTVPQPVAPVLPVTQADLIPATQGYEHYVSGQIPSLVRLSSALQAAIRDGDRAKARAAWLTAHLAYERLGAAYDAFGEADAAINGRPEGLPRGVRDPGWTGFHRIEYGLWHGRPTASLLKAAADLVTAVRALGAQFATAQIDPLVISIRAHEITENALQFELTGQSDYGSHSGLATTRADLAGTRVVLDLVTPVLASRYPQLEALKQTLTRAEHDLDSQHRAGRWPGPADLSRPDRELINSDLSRLSEMLAPVASILEPRRNS